MADYDWEFDRYPPPWEVTRREREEARKAKIDDMGFNIIEICAPGYLGSTRPLEVYVCQQCRAIVDHAELHREVCEI